MDRISKSRTRFEIEISQLSYVLECNLHAPIDCLYLKCILKYPLSYLERNSISSQYCFPSQGLI